MSTSRDRPTSGVSPRSTAAVESGATDAGAQYLERVRRRPPLHRHLAQVQRLEESRDGGVGGLAHHHAARPRRLLKARGQVGGVAHRRVVHPQVIADLPDDDGPRVEADPHLQGKAALALDLPIVVSERPLDRERGVRRPARAVLVSDRGAEERHHAVARVLVDRALEPVNLGRDQLEASVHDAVHVLRIQLLGERGEARDVGEEDGHLAALALEGGTRTEDLVGEMPRRIGRHRTAVGEGTSWVALAAPPARPVARSLPPRRGACRSFRRTWPRAGRGRRSSGTRFPTAPHTDRRSGSGMDCRSCMRCTACPRCITTLPSGELLPRELRIADRFTDEDFE